MATKQIILETISKYLKDRKVTVSTHAWIYDGGIMPDKLYSRLL